MGGSGEAFFVMSIEELEDRTVAKKFVENTNCIGHALAPVCPPSVYMTSSQISWTFSLHSCILKVAKALETKVSIM